MKTTILDRPVSSLIRLDWEKALYIILIILALTTRLWGLGDRVQSHDESIHTRYSWNLYVGHGFQHSPLMHGPFLFHATALSYFLFSDNDFTARLPVALMGVALVAFPWLLRRWLGRAGALVTSFFLLISPSIAYYSRYIRHDIPVILWALIVVLAIFSYLRDGRARWLYLMAAGVSLMFATKEVAFIYCAIFGLFLVGLFVLQALTHSWGVESMKGLFLTALVVGAVGLLVFGLGVLVNQGSQGVAQVATEGMAEAAEAVEPPPQPLAWWAMAGAFLAGLSLIAGMTFLIIGTWSDLREYRAFDLSILLGTLCLPFLSPLLITLVGLDPVDYTTPTLYYSGAITGAVALISIVIGLVWNWRRWGTAAAIHYAIFVVLFTTFFTNGTGIASGLVGSLGYWLAQQEVQRGGQPWYYYSITVLLYEYLPLLLTLIAPIYLIFRPRVCKAPPQPPPSERGGGEIESERGGELRRKSEWEGGEVGSEWEGGLRERSEQGRGLWGGQSPFVPSLLPFVPFLLWWTGLAWVGYSYAGEKMPWLTVHLALPMILIGGWLAGRLIEATNWRQVFERRAWLLALVAPPFVMAVAMVIDAISRGAFQGYELGQLDITGRFLGGLGGALVFGAGLVYLVYRSGWRVAVRVLLLIALLVPVFITVRTAWRFCYVTYDYPTEFLVYAHAGPAVNETMRQIDELSRRVAGGSKHIKIAYGADGSTLFYWQLRDYPNQTFYGEGENLSREQMDAPVIIAGRGEWDKVTPYIGDEYLVNTYTFLWWPMEDYRNLTWARITHAITDTQTRAALWDIWYDRDYRRYDEVTGTTHTLDAWPLRSEYRLYIRRDVAAQMWDLSTTGPTEIGPVNPYAEGYRKLVARQVFGSPGPEPGQLQSPRGITVGPDGFVYVADAGNNRIQKFTADGEFVAAWDGIEAGGFNDPWDVAVAPDGTIYLADTWNHRIRKLDAAGNVITSWGGAGQFGPDDASGENAFYGPRGITVGPGGRVYVTDTGNKRIQVFKPDGEFDFQWGGGGVLEGYMDEPVGIAVGPGGTIYVADTWNQRVQVFDGDGTFLWQWPIAGWDAGVPDEKPYLAVDAAGYVYVTDPGHYRVLVFDSLGNYVLSFGQFGSEAEGIDSALPFAMPMGIAVGQDGSVYVTDARGGRVFVFDPIETMNNEQ